MTPRQCEVFDRHLASHLVRLLRAGCPFSGDLIQQGYFLARCELGMNPAVFDDPVVRELESCFVDHDLRVIKPYARALRQLSFDEGSRLLCLLLQDGNLPFEYRGIASPGRSQ